MEHKSLGDDIVHLQAKIEDINSSGTLYTVEAIVLQNPEVNRSAKTGAYTQSATTIMGDDTGEIRIWAKGKRSSLLQKLRVGDRIIVFDAMARTDLNNKLELSLETYSSVEIAK